MPEELSSLLQMKRDNNSSQAARLKIFKAHFHENDEDLTSFTICMKKNALPHAIAWMARDDSSEFYKRSIDCISVKFRLFLTLCLLMPERCELGRLTVVSQKEERQSSKEMMIEQE